MAAPISRETYLADMVALREQIVNLEGAGNIEDAVQKGIPIQKAMAKIAEKIIMSIASLGQDGNPRDDRSAGDTNREET